MNFDEILTQDGCPAKSGAAVLVGHTANNLAMEGGKMLA